MSNSVAEPIFEGVASSGESVKLLVFEIGKLTLALPILQVKKVIRQQEVFGSGMSHVNLTHLNESAVTIVDLHLRLFGKSLTQSESAGYFILSQSQAGETLGIVVPQSPSLVDVALEKVRLLPESYRQADTLAIASHVTVLTHDDTTTTIFILDLTRLM